MIAPQRLPAHAATHLACTAMHTSIRYMQGIGTLDNMVLPRYSEKLYIPMNTNVFHQQAAHISKLRTPPEFLHLPATIAMLSTQNT